MPTFNYSVPDFIPFDIIKSADVSQRFTDLASFLNGQIGNSNISPNSLVRSNVLAAGNNNYVVINDNTGKMSEEAQLATSRGGLGFSPTVSPSTAGQVIGVNGSGNALTLLNPSSATLTEQLGGVVTGIQAGEAITANDAVSLILNQGTYKVVRCQASDGTRAASFWGFATNTATVTPQIVTLTQSGSWTTGSITVTVNNRSYTQAFSSNNDTSMNALAAQIAADPDVQSAAGSGSPVAVITITSKGGLTIDITSNSTGGAPTLAVATTQSPNGDAVTVQMFGPMDGFSGLTTSDLYYSSDTIGQISSGVTPGAVFAGQALSSTVLFVMANNLNPRFGFNRLYVRAMGLTNRASLASATSLVEHYSGSAWATGTSSPVAKVRAGSSDASAFNLFWFIDGLNSSGTLTHHNYSYNKASWSSHANRTTLTQLHSLGAFNNYLYVSKGYDGTYYATIDKFNQTSWSSGTAWNYSAAYVGIFSIVSMLYSPGGHDGINNLGVVETRTTTDTVSSTATLPTNGETLVASNSPNSLGIVTSASVTGSNTAVSYSFNGVSWSATITAAYSQDAEDGNGQAFGPTGSYALGNGGSDGSSMLNTTQSFNGTSYSTGSASSNSISSASMGTA